MNYLTVNEAAQMLEVSTKTIYRALESGKLKAKKIGGKWYIYEPDLLSGFIKAPWLKVRFLPREWISLLADDKGDILQVNTIRIRSTLLCLQIKKMLETWIYIMFAEVREKNPQLSAIKALVPLKYKDEALESYSYFERILEIQDIKLEMAFSVQSQPATILILGEEAVRFLASYYKEIGEDTGKELYGVAYDSPQLAKTLAQEFDEEFRACQEFYPPNLD
jgi:excisionase family DNA binding protein